MRLLAAAALVWLVVTPIATPADPSTPAQAVLVLGAKADFATPSPEAPLALAAGGEGREGWSQWTAGFECPDRPDGWYPYAGLADLPDGGQGCLRWRAIRPMYVAEVRLAPTAPWRSLEVRYKDNLFPPAIDRYRPKRAVTASVWDGRGFRTVATLESRRDHQWKSAVVPLDAARPTGQGHLAVRLGGGPWGKNELYGSALVHRLVASTEPAADLRPEPPRAGFWPSVPDRPQRRFGETGFRRPDGRPAFPIAATIPMLDYHPSQFENLAWAGFDTAFATVSGEGAGWSAWTSRRSEPQRRGDVYLGLPEKLAAYKGAGLDVVVWNQTDTRRWWMRNWGGRGKERVDPWFLASPYRRLYDGTAQGVTRVWRQALRDYGRHPSVVGWYLKDEFDHDNDTWGSPEETVRQLYALVVREAPHLATFVGAMGWKPGTLEAASDLGDVVAFDRYPAGDARSPRGETAQWAEAARRAVAPGQMWVSIAALSRAYAEADFRDPSRWEPVETSVRFQYYVALVHGAQMVWTFGDVGPRERYGAASLEWWTALRAANREVATLGLPLLHAGAGRTLGRSVAGSEPSRNPPYPLEASSEGDGTSTHPQVSTLFREGRDGARVLLALNEWSRPASRVRLRIEGLEAGTCLTVLFEGRSACAREAGVLVDDFDPYARHVYLVRAPSASGRERPR